MSTNNQNPKKRKISPWILVVFVLFGLGIIGQNSQDTTNSTSSESNTSESTNWVPDGYLDWDGVVAYKWVDKPKCDYGSVCTAIRVTAQKDCPRNIYAEILLQDKNYVQYDYTNDSQGSLMQGDTAELTFNFSPDSRFAHFKLSKISCL